MATKLSAAAPASATSSTSEGDMPLSPAVKKLVEEKKVMYNHSLDKKRSKWSGGEKLETLKLDEMPEYIKKNYLRYKPWLDNI